MNNQNISVEAVTISVDYSDYLKKIISNKEKLNRWIIVTIKEDYKTIKVCKDNKLDFICTDRLYESHSHFAKGKAINDGLNVLDKDDWLLQLDSDTLLPDNPFIGKFNKECIYGCSREYNGKKRVEINPYDNTVHTRPLIGFFQLWHSSKFKNYPEESPHAGIDDQLMSERYEWPDKWKYLNITCKDVSGIFCKNWYGRKYFRRYNIIK
jgi:hypothetical protein